jgi:hypothetical protein
VRADANDRRVVWSDERVISDLGARFAPCGVFKIGARVGRERKGIREQSNGGAMGCSMNPALVGTDC